jgi:hydroxyacylglutathione hydrolase
VVVHRIVTGSLNENCYVVSLASDAVIVDPGREPERIADHVTARGLRVHAVIGTHAHHDHVGGVAELVEEYAAPFYLHPDDAGLLQRANFYATLVQGGAPIRIPKIDMPLADRETLRFGALEMRVEHTPGHTPGSCCLAAAGELLTGDTVMAEHVGRTDLPGGDRRLLEASVALLADRYSAETTIRPGHGEPARLSTVVSRLSTLAELR